MKDYYKIMDVSSNAAQADIRAAYHKLAKQFHPDTNPGDNQAAHRFIELQEAYFILSDEDRRRQFHLRSSYPIADHKKIVDETPETILNKVRKLNQLLKEIDVFRMNRSLFSQAIFLLLSDQNISTLNKANNLFINSQIVEQTLQLSRVISYKENLKLANKLLVISGGNNVLHQSIYRVINQKRVKNFWDKYNFVIIAFITLIICLLILIISD